MLEQEKSSRPFQEPEKESEINTDIDASEISELLSIQKLKNYGNGNWFWQKSCEAENPDGRISSLSCSQETLLNKLTFLAFAGESWMIRAAASYLVKACGGKLRKRTIEKHLMDFRKMGLLQLYLFDQDKGNVYLLNPIMMRTEQAATLRYYDRAAELIIKIVARPPSKKRSKPKKAPMSADEQKKYLRNVMAQSSLELTHC